MFNVLAFQPPHARARALDGPIRYLAENLLAVNDYVARTATAAPGQKTDKSTSMLPVNTMVEYCHIVALDAVIQTEFTKDTPVPAEDQNSGASEENTQPEADATRPVPSRNVPPKYIDNLLLTVSSLEYNGLHTSFLKPSGLNDDENHYTITGVPFTRKLPNEVRRHISMIFIWSASDIVSTRHS
jgi:hypothetical protein